MATASENFTQDDIQRILTALNNAIAAVGEAIESASVTNKARLLTISRALTDYLVATVEFETRLAEAENQLDVLQAEEDFLATLLSGSAGAAASTRSTAWNTSRSRKTTSTIRPTPAGLLKSTLCGCAC